MLVTDPKSINLPRWYRSIIILTSFRSRCMIFSQLRNSRAKITSSMTFIFRSSLNLHYPRLNGQYSRQISPLANGPNLLLLLQQYFAKQGHTLFLIYFKKLHSFRRGTFAPSSTCRATFLTRLQFFITASSFTITISGLVHRLQMLIQNTQLQMPWKIYAYPPAPIMFSLPFYLMMIEVKMDYAPWGLKEMSERSCDSQNLHIYWVEWILSYSWLLGICLERNQTHPVMSKLAAFATCELYAISAPWVLRLLLSAQKHCLMSMMFCVSWPSGIKLFPCVCASNSSIEKPGSRQQNTKFSNSSINLLTTTPIHLLKYLTMLWLDRRNRILLILYRNCNSPVYSRNMKQPGESHNCRLFKRQTHSWISSALILRNSGKKGPRADAWVLSDRFNITMEFEVLCDQIALMCVCARGRKRLARYCTCWLDLPLLQEKQAISPCASKTTLNKSSRLASGTAQWQLNSRRFILFFIR